MLDHRPISGRAPARERRLARTGLACAVSVGVHALTLPALLATGFLDALRGRERPMPIAMASLSPAEWEANRGLSADVAAARAPDLPRRIIALPPDVESDPFRSPRPPDEARHLAERDQTADAEAVSEHAVSSVEKVLRVPQVAFRGRAGGGERGRAKIALPGREGPRAGGGSEPDVAEEARITPRPDALASSSPANDDAEARPALPPPEDAALPAEGDGEGGRRIEGPSIRGAATKEHPRPEGGPNLDGLDEAEGAETRLHASRFEPAAFWIDVRDRLQGEWEKRAIVLVHEHDPAEDTYFYKPRTVVVRLSLEANGLVRDVRVVESSRLDFYDALAVATVQEQSPFPEPPPAALGSDGSARINVRFTWVPTERRKTLR